MTENELRKLTPAERQALPEHVRMGALLRTREEMDELLAIEGFEFVGMDDRLRDEPDYDPAEDSEVYRRQVGGRVEWAEVYPHPVEVPGLPPEQRFYRAMWDTDPRLIED